LLAGDKVRIIEDQEVVQRLQKGHGGWVCRMKDVCHIFPIFLFVSVCLSVCLFVKKKFNLRLFHSAF